MDANKSGSKVSLRRWKNASPLQASGLEKDPKKELKNIFAGGSIRNGRIGADVNGYDAGLLEPLFVKIRASCKTQGTIVKTFFADFDRNNDGCVTSAQFKRGMNQVCSSLEPGINGI